MGGTQARGKFIPGLKKPGKGDGGLRGELIDDLESAPWAKKKSPGVMKNACLRRIGPGKVEDECGGVFCGCAGGCSLNPVSRVNE